MKKPAGVLLKAALLVVVVAFVGFTAWDLAVRWRDSPSISLHAGFLVASVVPVALVSAAQAFGWMSLVHQMVGRTLPRVASLELFLASMLGRYAPAKVGMPAILMSRARQLDLSPTLMASSMVLVVLAYTILGVGIGVAALSLGAGPMPTQLQALRGGLAIAALVGMGVAVISIMVIDRRRLPAAFVARLGASGEGPLVGPGLVIWYVIVWLAWWAHGALLIQAVGGDWAAATQGAGLFVLAPVVGFLALVAPGGLGVREALLAGGLGALVGPGPAVVAAVASRFASLGIDVLMWLALRWAKHREGRPPPAVGDVGKVG